MAVSHVDRIARLNKLKNLIPSPRKAIEDCPDVTRLHQSLEETYGNAECKSARRKIQRDLVALVESGEIQIVNPGGKPLRYQKFRDSLMDDKQIWAFNIKKIQDFVAEFLPRQNSSQFWEKINQQLDFPLFEEDRLRVVPASLRLIPAEIKKNVLQSTLVALAERCSLNITYQDRENKRSNTIIHPQGLIQRGPRTYLFAMKESEDLIRMFAVHRIISAKENIGEKSRESPDFNLDKMIKDGIVDFGNGEYIDLEFRAKGYIADLLHECKIEENQIVVDEPEESKFKIYVKVRVPSTGELFRWLLSAGNHIEVIKPDNIRNSIIAETTKTLNLYNQKN